MEVDAWFENLRVSLLLFAVGLVLLSVGHDLQRHCFQININYCFIIGSIQYTLNGLNKPQIYSGLGISVHTHTLNCLY